MIGQGFSACFKEFFMKLQTLIDYGSTKKGVTQEFPFDDSTLVFKVMGKMFALVNLDPPHSVNLKCDPIYAIALRQKYKGVQAGYHMNKRHWNTVDLEADYDDNELCAWIDDSYHLVIKGLTRAKRDRLNFL